MGSPTTNILVTNFQNSSEDVMIFTKTLTVETVTEKLNKEKEHFDEIYEVKTDDLQFYLYEPCWFG